METTTLKSSFFGYSKTSVCEYIARINEEYSKKITDVYAEKDKMQQELRERIAQLEKENEHLRNNHDEVAAILLDAKTFADQLHTKAEAENQKLRAENKARSDAEIARIHTYQKSINVIQNEIRQLLETMDEELTKDAKQLSELAEGVSNYEDEGSDKEENTNV